MINCLFVHNLVGVSRVQIYRYASSTTHWLGYTPKKRDNYKMNAYRQQTQAIKPCTLKGNRREAHKILDQVLMKMVKNQDFACLHIYIIFIAICCLYKIKIGCGVHYLLHGGINTTIFIKVLTALSYMCERNITNIMYTQ